MDARFFYMYTALMHARWGVQNLEKYKQPVSIYGNVVFVVGDGGGGGGGCWINKTNEGYDKLINIYIYSKKD